MGQPCAQFILTLFTFLSQILQPIYHRKTISGLPITHCTATDGICNSRCCKCCTFTCTLITGRGSSKILRGTGDEKFGAKGGYPLKNTSVLVHMENFATFLYFSFLFSIFLSNFSPSLFRGGETSSTKNFRGTCPPKCHTSPNNELLRSFLSHYCLYACSVRRQ